VDFQLNYKLKNKIDEFSRRSNYDHTVQSTSELKEICAEMPKS